MYSQTKKMMWEKSEVALCFLSKPVSIYNAIRSCSSGRNYTRVDLQIPDPYAFGLSSHLLD